MIKRDTISLSTEPDNIYDISSAAAKFLSAIGAKDGALTVFAVGSTCGITTIEYEPGLRRDFPEMLERIAPKGSYRHDAAWGDGNGHSHLRSSLVGTSLTIPVVDGKIATGTWQQIVFCEFDVRPRKRKIISMFIGETN